MNLILYAIEDTGLLGNLAILLVFQIYNIALISLNQLHRMSNHVAFFL